MDLSDLPPDVHRGHVYVGTIVGFLVVSVLAISVRTWTRIQFTSMWWDDYLMLIVLPFLIANNTLSLLSVKYGVGRHIFYLAPTDAMEAGKLNTIAQPLNIWALYFVKVSIVCFILRLKPGKIYKDILYATIVLLTLITVESFIVTMAQCQPLEKEWNPTVKGFCWSPNVFTYSAYVLSGVTILTDLVYIILPIFYLWNVNLKASLKYGIWGVLGLGVVSMGCSSAAIPFIKELSETEDVTWEIVTLAAIKTAELNVAILTACIPPLQPLFFKAKVKLSTVGNPRSQETWESRQAKMQGKSGYEMLLNGKPNFTTSVSQGSLRGNDSLESHPLPNISGGPGAGGNGLNSNRILATTYMAVEREI